MDVKNLGLSCQLSLCFALFSSTSMAKVKCSDLNLDAKKYEMTIIDKQGPSFITFHSVKDKPQIYLDLEEKLKIKIPVYTVEIDGTSEHAQDIKDSFTHAALIQHDEQCFMDWFNVETQDDEELIEILKIDRHGNFEAASDAPNLDDQRDDHREVETYFKYLGKADGSCSSARLLGLSAIDRWN